MELKCLHSALPLRSASLLLVGLLAAALAGGCAVQKTIVYEGRAFPVERIVGIDAAFRDGLDRDAVRGLLGAPYATGSDADGQAFWLYRYRGQSTTSGFEARVYIEAGRLVARFRTAICTDPCA